MLWIPLNLSFFLMILPASSPFYVSSEVQQTVTYQITYLFSPVCAWNVLSSVLFFVNGMQEMQETQVLQPTRLLWPWNFLQARMCGAISYSQGSSQPTDWTCVSCISRCILYHCTTWEALYSLAAAAAAKSYQSCPTLCDPIDGSLPGSSVPGILQFLL